MVRLGLGVFTVRELSFLLKLIAYGIINGRPIPL